MRSALTSELAVLAHLLDRIPEMDRHTRDFTLQELRAALVETVACFPVYRTDVNPEGATETDRKYVHRAIAQAKRRSLAVNLSIFDFLRQALLVEGLDADDPRRALMLDFAMKFQQYTAPAMAKGLEDTIFYLYNRLVSLNEVGGDPRRFGVALDEFHRAMVERADRHPYAMLASSTHDTKRCEDVRARLDVLSEIPGEWRARAWRTGAASTDPRSGVWKDCSPRTVTTSTCCTRPCSASGRQASPTRTHWRPCTNVSRPT